MTQQQTSAVAKAQEAPVVDLGVAATILSVARRDDVERFETIVDLPASFQYVIPTRKKVSGKWVDAIGSIGITSDGYDYLNRVLGVSFFLPEFVPDETGQMVRNPIHRKDYVYLRMGAVWYNETGQLQGATEDLEVDFQLTYQAARLEAAEAEVAIDENGQPLFDEHGQALIRMVPKPYRNDDGSQSNEPFDAAAAAAKAEKKALKALMQLRTMGMRYAQTVLRTRLIKVAVGIKSLPVRPGQTEPKAFKLRVVGYRDQMTPLERQTKATKTFGALFGGSARPADAKPLTAAELADIEHPGADDEVAETLLVATGVIAEQGGDEDPGPQPDEFDLPVSRG